MLQLGFPWILELGFRLFCLPNRLSKTKEKKVDAINPQLSERRRRGPSSLVKFCYILSKNKKENWQKCNCKKHFLQQGNWKVCFCLCKKTIWHALAIFMQNHANFVHWREEKFMSIFFWYFVHRGSRKNKLGKVKNFQV